MRKKAWIVLATVAAVSVGCGKDNNGSSSNNGSTNNGTSSNNGTTAPNNGTTAPNNGTTAPNNGTTAPNNGTTAPNNGTTSSNNGTAATNNGTVGPLQSCDEGGLTECFYNGDCADAERCEDVGDGTLEVACCVMGARGTKTVGEQCTSENECDSGLCVQRNEDPYICSKPCAGPDDCPETLECHGALGLCVTM